MTATASPTATTFPCPRCGAVLVYGQLACPRCGALVYSQRLNELAAAAQQQEPVSPIRAAMIWRECLPLLPPDSQQYQVVSQRIAQLATGFGNGANGAVSSPYSGPTYGSPTYADAPTGPTGPAIPARRDPWQVAFAKTFGSMLVSIVVYAMMFSGEHGTAFGLKFATGFVILMLIHELGHSFAMRYYGLSASPPIFIPFLGAVINLRQMPRNALEEAVVGIGGPVTGTIAAAVTYGIYLKTGSLLFLQLAEFGFLLNLFNMLPVPPLDGGRVTAAVSPWIWIPGLLVAVGLIVLEYLTSGHVNPILILLLIFAAPRIKKVLIERQHRGAYYQIGRAATWTMGISYVLLGLFLAVMFVVTQMEIAKLREIFSL